MKRSILILNLLFFQIFIINTWSAVSIRTSIENHFKVAKSIILRSVVKNESGIEIASVDTPVSLTSSANLKDAVLQVVSSKSGK